MKLFQKKHPAGAVPKRTRSHDQRGVITVMVVLLLVPTIVVEGFLVDLARLKLYGNQAVMTADNYGEAVLSVYNNVLKDLYGFFAISEDKGAGALSSLKDFMPSSFDPNKKAISFGHLTGVQNAAGLATKYSGFMPYDDAQVELSYEVCKNSALSDTDIFATQLGDFMRFRVAQPLFDGGTQLIDALDNVMSMEANSKVIKKKEDFDDAVDELIERCKDFYELAWAFNQYCVDYTGSSPREGYLQRINSRAIMTYNDLRTVAQNGSLRLYREYEDNKTAINAALTHQKNLKKGESLSAEELRMIDIHNRYQADPQARRGTQKKWFEEVVAGYAAVLDFDVISFGGFDSMARDIRNTASKIERTYNNLEEAITRLEASLNDPDVTQDLRDGIKEDIQKIREMFASGSSYSAANFKGLADMIYGHSGSHNYNDEQKKLAEKHLDVMEQQINAYLDGTTPPADGKNLNTNGYNEFYKVTNYKTLYDQLRKMFLEEGDDGSAKKRKNAAKGAADDASEKFKGTDTSDARDIPGNIAIGTADYKPSLDNLAFKRLIDTALSIFDANSVSEGFNELVLKVYTVLYDNEMFSSRVTNKDQEKKPENERTVAESMTGYTLCREINYLFGAELEYLFGGYKSSSANLTEARNKIVAFRAIVNFTASYSIKEVNRAIKGICTPVKAINAAVGIALESALRIAFAMIETAADWDELMEGEGVVLLKKDLDDMSAPDKIADLIPEVNKEGSRSGQSTAFRMNYETYLTVMMLAMTTDETIFSRTADLISLNVSTVESGLSKDETLSALSFDMKKAYTAVNASCSVKLDFAVLPLSMANMLLGGDTATLEQIRERGFRFTVTRGY